MQVEHINPFLDGIVNMFSTMLNTDARRGKLTLGDPDVRAHPISGIIGLTGRAAGTVVINVSEKLALEAASVMLMETKESIDDEVLDAVGELANMVAGQAKAELEQYELSISLPNVVTGDGHTIRFPGTKPLCVPFDSELGPLRLEVGFEEAAKPALA